MTSTLSDLQQHVLGLLAANEPLSFLDAFDVVRQARSTAALDDALLGALLAMHDSPHTTDGGRAVLADFLRTVAQSLAQERALAARVVKVGDSGKCARAKAGQTLKISLGEPTCPASAWQLVGLAGPARLEANTPARALEEGCEWRLLLLRPGFVQLDMRAPAAKAARTPAARGARQFVLAVVVEK
jgi:hypothetical protein